MSNNHNGIYSKPLLFSIIVLVVILMGSVFTAFYPLIRDEMHPQLENHMPYTPLELAGRDLYQKEGCTNCHTQVVRPLKTDVLRYGDFSKAGESYNERPFLWGSRRTGPDLARIGSKYSDEWHVQHFENPQLFEPKSNMPRYTWFKERQLNPAQVEKHMNALKLDYTAAQIDEVAGATELDAMIAYMQKLGTAVEPFHLITITDEDYARLGNPVAGVAGAAEKGHVLYEMYCGGCHGREAEGNIGLALNDYGSYIDEEVAFLTIANGFSGFMPGFANVMSREQIGSIVEYLKTLTAEDAENI